MSRNQSQRSASFRRTLAVVPFSLLAVAGCAQIIGLGDYTVGGGGSGGGATGGSAGTLGEAGEATGATGGKAGSTGKGGTGGGSGGSTPVAGTTSIGEAGAAGATTVPPANLGCDNKTPFTPNENIIRSCILRAGCSINSVPVRTISECVSKNTQAALPGESCNLTSQTCADYEACEHSGRAHDDLCGGTKVTRCENGKAINCGNYTDGDLFYDCTAQGLGCGTFTDTANSLLYADCTVPNVPAATCTGISDDSSFYCQAGTSTIPDAYYYCYAGQAYGASCSKFATCQDSTQTGGNPDATCYFTFPSQCTGQPDSAACNGNVAKVCSVEDIINYDCTTVGLTCGTKGTDGYCVAPGCKPANVDACVESCGDDGVTLNFCYGGVPHSVDCTAYGFAACNEGTSTDSNNKDFTYANCR